MTILYCRKSTESEDRQVLSIESQINELKELALKENLKIDKTIIESKSAKAPGRPGFDQLLNLIQKNQNTILLCWKLDRLARNPIDGGKIAWFLQQGLIKEIKTPERSYFPNDNVLMMTFEFGMANQYVRDLSNNVKRGNKTKLEKGGWTGVAPIGYLNDKSNQTIIIDPIRSKHIIRAFELFATKAYSPKDIIKILWQDGLRGLRGKQVSRSSMYRTLNNPFYTGTMLRLGKLYQGAHTPLISQALFDQCQQIFSPNNKRSQKHFFPLRGYVRCANCGCSLTAAKKKGFVYYYCTNGKGICEQHKSYLRKEKLEKLVGKVLGKIKLDAEMIEISYLAAKEKLTHLEDHKQLAKQTTLKQLESLKHKQIRLEDAYLEGSMTKERYNARILELANDEIVFKNQIKQIERVQGYDTLEQTKKAFLTAYTAEKDFLNSDDDRKSELAKILLWNVEIKNKEVQNYQLKQPYQLMAEAEQKTSLSRYSLWRVRRDLNPRSSP